MEKSVLTKYILYLSYISIMIIASSCDTQSDDKIKLNDTTINERSKYQHFSDTISIIGVGDIMLGTNFPSVIHLPPNNIDLLKNVREFLISGDITFGNLEGSIADSGGIPKTCSDPKICYNFRQPEYLISHLVNSGFDFLSVANNHIYDFGEEIAINTVNSLKKIGFRVAGINNFPYDTMTYKGLKIGFTAFAPNPGTLSITDYDLQSSIISHLDTICDIVIVSFHGGAEGTKHRRITMDYEEFYEENRGNVYQFAHNAIDNGADIVFGHGPHVTRAIEIYKDRFIAYSLGNFCTYNRFNISGLNGIAPAIKLFVDRNGKFLSGEVLSIQQKGRGIPLKDTLNRALKEIIELTDLDFPDHNIKFEDNKFYQKKILNKSEFRN